MALTLNVYTFLAGMGIWAVVASILGFRKAKDKRRYVLKETVVGVPIILFLFLFGPLILLSPVKPGFDSIKDEKATVFYPSSKIDLGKDLLEKSLKAVENNERFYKIPVKTQFLVAPTRFDMLRLTLNPIIAGGTGADFGVIVRYDKLNEGIITHELSHIILPKMTGRSGLFFPRWFDEGLASYLGKMDYYKDIPELRDSLKEGTYKGDLKRWEGLLGKINWNVFDVRCCARQIYGQTYQMVKYLFDNYGEDKVYQLLVDSQKISFEEAFQKAFGRSVDAYHQEFINYIQNYQQKP